LFRGLVVIMGIRQVVSVECFAGKKFVEVF
jgi:hypothetical protein